MSKGKHVALVGPELEENLALRYLNASLTQAGHRAEIYDFHGPEQIEGLAERLAADQPDMVGLSMVFTARARQYLRLAAALRERRYPGHITAGGHFASFNAQALLSDYPALSSIVHGEGEEAIVELAERIGPQGQVDGLPSVAGLSFRSARGEIVYTGRREPLADLDQRPTPTRPAQFQDYFGLPIANMLSSRGCYGNCRFCSINAWHRANGGRRFRQRDPQRVAGEMAALYHDRGARIFNFHDDQFLLPTEAANLARLAALRWALDAAGVGRIAVQIKARPDSLTPAVLDALERLGLFRVFLGVETNAVAGLKTLGRDITLAQNHRALKLLAGRGIHHCFNLLMFDPDAQLADLRDNLRLMRRFAAVPLNFCRVEIYAGTALERQLREEGRLEGDYLGYYYTIAEPRVQLAYQIFRHVFTPRNFELAGMNHRAMAVDYELQLLRHFYPRRVSRGLVRHAKGLVAELNRNNAALLEEICRFVEHPQVPGEAAVQDFVVRVAEAREAFDRAMGPRMEEVRRRIAELATLRSPARALPRPVKWFRTAVSTAGALAVAVLGRHEAGAQTPAQGEPGPSRPSAQAGEPGAGASASQQVPPKPIPPTHPFEVAPVPQPPPRPIPPTHPFEIAPQPLPPQPPAPPGGEEPGGDEAAKQRLAVARYQELGAMIEKQHLPALRQLAAQHMALSVPVMLRLQIDQKGAVVEARAEPAMPEGQRQERLKSALEAAARKWKFSEGAAGWAEFPLDLDLKPLPPEETQSVRQLLSLVAPPLVVGPRGAAVEVQAAVYVALEPKGRVRRVHVHAAQARYDFGKGLPAALQGTALPQTTGYCTVVVKFTRMPDHWHMCEFAPRHLDDE